ncbi:MAG TPA: hypothetical protein VLM89_01850 [Phycisphaerae bacterium]|nr:hypothetical protein [Phycisphaerae bacterium]
MSAQTAEQMCFGFFSRLPIVIEPTNAQISGDMGIPPIRQFDGHRSGSPNGSSTA